MQINEQQLAIENTPWGSCEVWQKGTVRSLYIHNKMAIQSQLDMAHKEKLLLEHSRAMMSFLLFQKKPKSVLLLGLGGGSIIHFLQHWFPQAKIVAVDISEQMVNIAQQYFDIEKNAQVDIKTKDALDYLRQPDNKKKKLSVIMVDIHDGKSIPDFLHNTDFLNHCHQALTKYGILVMNLLINNDHDFLQIMTTLRQSFTGISVVMPLKDQKNIIVFAFKSLDKLDRETLHTSAAEQEEKYDIEFTRFIHDIEIIEPKKI